MILHFLCLDERAWSLGDLSFGSGWMDGYRDRILDAIKKGGNCRLRVR